MIQILTTDPASLFRARPLCQWGRCPTHERNTCSGTSEQHDSLSVSITAEGSVSRVMDEEDSGAFLAKSKLCGYQYEPRCSAEGLQSGELWRQGSVPTGEAVANARHVGIVAQRIVSMVHSGTLRGNRRHGIFHQLSRSFATSRVESDVMLPICVFHWPGQLFIHVNACKRPLPP